MNTFPAEHNSQCGCGDYVLMTAAHNEEELIGATIESVIAQTLLPKRWVIISDGSQDRTASIVEEYSKNYEFIRFLPLKRKQGRSFKSKVIALHAGAKLVEEVPSEFVGNLDADITLDPSYFASLTQHFSQDSSLGIAGGFVCEEMLGQFQSRRGNKLHSVPHAAQLVRRECYDAIGGYAVCRYGGEDWHAQISAKMRGWSARTFPELRIFHHRKTGEGDNLLRHRFRLGRMDHDFGSYTPFEILKCLERIPERPFLIGGLLRLAGFTWSSLCREKSEFSSEFITFLRQEQKGKMKNAFLKPFVRTAL